MMLPYLREMAIGLLLSGTFAIANPATASAGAFDCCGGKTQYRPGEGAVWTNDVDCDQVIFSPTTTVRIGKDASSTRLNTDVRYIQGLPGGSGVFVVFTKADDSSLGVIWFGGLKKQDCKNETLNRTGDPTNAPQQMGLLDFNDLRKAASVHLFLWTGTDGDFTKCKP